ncbi:peptidase [Planotetraspora thailandica]|uniref:Peptidase n=1 Tax=Planotetraspora thailandica TaxID=487172 RepID=A0A8J3V1W1_9ACTN|nr:alpha/beta hydrolase [Planotetraspora thailandica]GII55196.1 peptidase [Planotetraspora thailandica]
MPVKRVVGVVMSVTMLGAVLGVGPDGARAAPKRAIAWGPCGQGGTSALGAALGPNPAPRRNPSPFVVECATVRVPLDHMEPLGQQISLALNRVRSSAAPAAGHLGALLVNPGGPGASGLDMARYVAATLPRDVAARYDVIGFDPRGVGASEPALRCVDPARYYAAPRPDNIPHVKAAEDVLVARAREYARACGNRWAWFLPYLTTENTARDMDVVRAALGEDKISYLGYSYGSYLGAVYATLFPQRVRRLVLDSVVDPSGVWYKANLAQDYSFDRRHKEFLAWVARNQETYRLGGSLAAVTFAWSALRGRLKAQPAGGVVGPSELDDIFAAGAYSSSLWPKIAQAFSDYVLKADTTGLVALYRSESEVDEKEENSYAVYLGIQCRDAVWPRTWDRWHTDTEKINGTASFMAWPNAVYNAPCAFWPERGGKPVRVGTGEVPPVLLLQSEDDAATPQEGAVHMRRLFPTARLVSQGGGEHGVSLAGSACADRYLAAYLRDPASLPERKAAAPDAACPAPPDPKPLTRMAAHARGPAVVR